MNKNHNRKEARFLLMLFVFLAAIVWFIPAEDFEFSEAECETLFSLGDEKYLRDFSFDDSWNFERRHCNSHETAILNALRFLEKTTMILPSGEPEFDFYAWMKEVKPILSKREILSFSGIANFETNRIDISTLKLKEGDPVSIANILIHEARHLEEGRNTHVPCRLTRTIGCDARLEENPFDGGAYNYNVAYLHRLLNHADTTRLQKHSARTLLGLILNNQINEISSELRAKYEQGL